MESMSLNSKPKNETKASDANAFETLKRAEKMYVETLKKSASTAAHHNQLSGYYHGKGKLLKAIFHANQALALDPTDPLARNNLSLFTRELNLQQENQQ